MLAGSTDVYVACVSEPMTMYAWVMLNPLYARQHTPVDPVHRYADQLGGVYQFS